MFCKNSTNLSFVEPPFSYNIHPIYLLLDIADNNVNFLNTKLSFVFIIHLLPISYLKYSIITAGLIDVSSMLIILFNGFFFID